MICYITVVLLDNVYLQVYENPIYTFKKFLFPHKKYKTSTNIRKVQQ